jgi:hypothetical protein
MRARPSALTQLRAKSEGIEATVTFLAVSEARNKSSMISRPGTKASRAASRFCGGASANLWSRPARRRASSAPLPVTPAAVAVKEAAARSMASTSSASVGGSFSRAGSSKGVKDLARGAMIASFSS